MATRKTPAAKTAAAPAAKTPATKTPARKQAARPAAAKAVPAPAAKPVAAKPAAAAKPAKPAKPAKVDKPKKPKLVRDSFTIPKTEYVVIDALKQRAAKAGVPAKKSELLRAGIKALAAMGDADFVAAVKAVPAIKTGRPANP